MKGFAFHCYHDTLIDYVYDYQDRVGYIKGYKIASEQELRLRLFKMIPDERIPVGLLKTWEAYAKAWDKTREASDKAWKAYVKARKTYYKAYNNPEMKALHKELCPDCPFDNGTIFTRKDKDGEWY